MSDVVVVAQFAEGFPAAFRRAVITDRRPTVSTFSHRSLVAPHSCRTALLCRCHWIRIRSDRIGSCHSQFVLFCKQFSNASRGRARSNHVPCASAARVPPTIHAAHASNAPALCSTHAARGLL